ncbi:hypothetical protein BDP81DRAFT_427771 [Colletotrichum phormii]|uniref:Uncharacterized protein n=1 Tax=Colletotrichum phormii TaxID=359342 RepID=A0AAI9ZQX0_9PEZI|nr:uncharacterized protein BDP81DRAFT_427771 [Colletotrichum phormii]KAK1636529.1 hypothetical protein BDP81DRAFT_427771 [Colletotrichum phormii]
MLTTKPGAYSAECESLGLLIATGRRVTISKPPTEYTVGVNVVVDGLEGKRSVARYGLLRTTTHWH